MIKILVLLGILSLSLSQDLPPCIITCQVSGSSVGCPASSVCRNINPDGTVPRLVCVCNNIASTTCSPNGGFVCSSDNSTTNTGCGDRFPNGCPRDSSCVLLSTTNQRTCVCNTPGAYLDLINNVCVPPCPAYSVRNQNGVCECVAPYVRDTSVNELRCILGSGATCTNVNCPLNYHCEVPSNGGPVCVPNENSQVCGSDFRCPSPLVCVDTSTGPKCKCPQGFAGPSCAFRECYTLTGTNSLGCWAFNGTANCTLGTSSTETPYCRCKDNLIPPDCTPSVGPCASVDCSAIPNSRCYNGRCICKEGYVAVPSTTSPNTYTCRPVGSCNCTGNRICSSNGGCVCPADTLGGADCSRPACSTDADCTAAGLSHAYCVTNTNTGVRGFCVCSPGYSGERCDVATNNCDRNICQLPYRVCNNENRCVCAPEFNGTNCTRPVPPSCVSIRIIVRASANQVTAEQLTSILASFIGIDQSLINVTGPFPLPGNDTAVVFNVRICRDSSTNEQSASDDFVDNVNNGGASSFGIQSAAVGEYTGESSSSNGSAAIVFSVLLLCITAMFI